MDGRNGVDGMEASPNRTMRSPSISSDVMSTSTKSIGASTAVPSANPPPAYVAQDEASKLVSTELERAVALSPATLNMVNEFLDHVLYNIIYTSHSMSLGPLKAAVPSVLKPRLGKAALRVAEEELKEYLEEEEEVELNSRKSAFQPQQDFDTELVWKVARLRCMVYAKLGDLEEEDEEEWLDKDQLLEQVSDAQKRSKQSLDVGPGAAIFLAAVIDFLGEQALQYAAQHAQKRHDLAKTADSLTAGNEGDVIVVDGKDMNHVGRDSPLSRLWRSWRRNTRTNTESSIRPLSPESPKTGRSTSSGAHPPIPPIKEEYTNGVGGPSSRAISPSQIRLPMSENDVEEIEGTSSEVNGAASKMVVPERSKKRPVSLVAMPGQYASYTSQTGESEGLDFSEHGPQRPEPERKRSSSMPTVTTPFSADRSGPSADENTSSAMNGSEAKTSDLTTEAAKSDNLGTQGGGASHEQPRALQDADKEVAAPKQSGLIDGTLAAITGALGAVGVHHIAQEVSKPRTTSRPSSRLARNVSEDANPVTRASISGPSDFENMHIPQGQYTPNEAEAEQSQRDRDLAEGIVPALPPVWDQHQKSTHRPDSDGWKGDSKSNHQRFSGSSYYAATLPVVNESNNQPVDSREAAPSPTIRRFTPSPRVSSAGFPDRVSSLDDPTKTKHVANASLSSVYSHHSKSSSSSSRLLGFTRDGQGRPQTIHQQRAAGEMADDVRAAHSTTPTSRSRSRPQTSDSPTDQQRPHLRVKSDSSDVVKTAPPALEDAKRSLEVLINSEETLHYTLTPEAAEFPREQMNFPTPKKTATQDLADFLRNTGPPGSENASKTDQANKGSMRATPATVPAVPISERRLESAASTSATDKPRIRVGEPRDPVIRAASSTRDLADYVRSTGPTNEDQLPKALSGNTRPANGVVVKPSSASVVSESARSPTPKKPQNRLKFQARDARPARNTETSDLIDFIREGPPRTEGDHRIDRHVAPFRTTMDSDDLNALAPKVDERGIARASDTSTLETGTKSVDTSVNSQTALLNKSAVNGVGIAISSPMRQPISESDEGMPKRTRRRVKDPYAIDDSDDEVDEDMIGASKHNEESLIDFLRNTAPPPGMTAQPVLAASTPPGTASTAVQRSPSGNRLKEVMRGGRPSSTISDEHLESSKRNAREESPHLTQVGSKLDSYKPTNATHAAHVERNRNRSRSAGKDTLRKGTGDTADLAEYLRNTGPPPGKEYEPQPFILSSNVSTHSRNSGKPKEETSFKKFFSLKQKLRP